MLVLLIGVIVLISIFALIGLKRGFFKSLLGLIALVISLLGTYFLSPYVGSVLVSQTDLDDRIENKIYTKMVSSLEQSVADSLSAQGVTMDLNSLTEQLTQQFLEQGLDSTTEVETIQSMNIPQSMRQELIDNNNNEVYASLGVTDFYHYVSRFIAIQAMHVIATILTFICLRFIFLLASLAFSGLVRSMPMVGFINRVGGLLFGALVGLAFAMLFLSIAELVYGSQFDPMISQSAFLTKLQQANVISRLLANVSSLLDRM